MRRRDAAAALALVLAALAAVPARALKTEPLDVSGAALPAGAARARPLLVTSGQALLKLSAGTKPADLDAPLAALGVRRLSDLGRGWILAGWSDPAPVSQRLAALRTVPGVAVADPSRVYSPRIVPNDPDVASQWALSKVDAFRGWEFETGSSTRVTIAVIDTGIDGSHPDLSAKLANTTSFSYNPNCATVPCAATLNNPPTPACEHGTEVAGVAAASSNNGLDVAGMSWGAQLVSYKVFADADCNMNCTDKTLNGCLTNDPAIITAINLAALMNGTTSYGRVIINMSLGGPGACAAADQDAITAAVSSGVVVVAAAGNGDGFGGTGPIDSPGNCANVIPAGATDAADGVAGFSSNGPELAANGLVAPGVAVLTTHPGGTESSASGTSFASPMVAGAAALIVAAKPSYLPPQVKTYLRAGADVLSGPSWNFQGAGRLNIYRSLYAAVNGTLPPAGEVNNAPKSFAYPNPLPLSQAGGVQFSIPPAIQGGSLKVRVYTMDGHFVRETQTAIWDGRNAAGNKVATGTYMFIVKTDKGEATGRMTVIR